MKNVLCVLLSFFVLSVGNADAEVSIVTGDSPLFAHCCVTNPIECIWAGDIEPWGPDRWGNLSAIEWSPPVVGIKVNGTGEILLRFYFSEADLDFFRNAVFNGTDTRKPFALEFDIMDSGEVFGSEGDEEDYTVKSRGLPENVTAYYDVPWMDSGNTMSVIIPRPDLLEGGKIYEFIFTPKNQTSKTGNIHFTAQLSVNYKYLAALRYGQSSKCDLLDLIGDVHGMTSGEVNNLIGGNYGNSTPEASIDGWYYFLAADSDASNPISVGPGQYNSVCWNDFEDYDHNESNKDLCYNGNNLNLFNLNIGDDFYAAVEYLPEPSVPEIAALSPAPIGAGVESDPDPSETPESAKPDFVATEVKLKTVTGEEKYVWTKSEEMYIHAWVKNEGDADWEGSHDSIELRGYLSQGLKEDLHSEWERVGIDYIQKYNLELGDDPKHEDDRLILLNKDSIQPGNYYNVVVCVDRTADQDNGIGDVDEIHESNNCTTEAVFYVTDPEHLTSDDGTFSWSSSGLISSMQCTQIYESADPDTWYDNYLCTQNFEGIAWSSAGAISGMRCTPVTESAEPAESTWNDNFICVPEQSDLQLYWSPAGRIEGKDCVQWSEPADSHTWDDNWLCFDRNYNPESTSTPAQPLTKEQIMSVINILYN